MHSRDNLDCPYLQVCKDQEDISFTRVGDPHLAAVDQVVITVVNCTSLESKCIGTGSSFRQAEASHAFGGEFGKVAALDVFVTVLANKGTNQGVLM